MSAPRPTFSDVITQILRELDPQEAGVETKGRRLAAAILDWLKEEATAQGHKAPILTPIDLGVIRLALETQELVMMEREAYPAAEAARLVRLKLALP